MSRQDQEDHPLPELSTEIRFDYIKSNFFRVIYADGGLAHVSPSGKVHLALYGERGAIPQRTVHLRGPDNTLGAEIRDERVARDAIIREVEVDIVMDLDTAQRLQRGIVAVIEQANLADPETPIERE